MSEAEIVKLIMNGGGVALLGLFMWYVLQRQIPAREAQFSETIKQAFDLQREQQREFSSALDKEREAHHRQILDLIAAQNQRHTEMVQAINSLTAAMTKEKPG